MARIRSVHPDICLDETLAETSARAERSFVRLWTHLDDDGRCVDNPKLIKAALYPLADAMTAEEVDADLAELEHHGLVIRYTVAGKSYLSAKPEAWANRQRPRHPTPSKLPAPPTPSGDAPEPDGGPPENGRTPTAVRRNGSDERGDPPHVGVVGEGDVGGEVEPTVADHGAAGLALVPASASPPATGAAVQTVFDAWRQATGHHRALLDDKRRRVITARLRDYPVEDLVDAVRGWKLSPHHRGENERHTVYDGLELLLRDAEHVERFRDLQRHGPPAATPRLSRPVAAAQRALDRRKAAAT